MSYYERDNRGETLVIVYISQGQEITNLRREIEKQKELRNDTESKAKWANEKMKAELEAHKVH
jgi:hypothetical protein